MLNTHITQDKLKEKVVEYALMFGKPVDDQLENYLEKSFNWDKGYETKTKMINLPNITIKNYNL